MILRQPWQLGEEREVESDTEPSLLSRMSRNPRLTRNLSLKNQRSTSQHSHGLDQKGRLIPNCLTTWSGRSNSLEFTPWTLRRRYDGEVRRGKTAKREMEQVNAIGGWLRMIRDWHGLPWGFSGLPVPVPQKTRTRV